MEINFKIENDYIPSLNKSINPNENNNDDIDNNVIILDDDDFIQTTFNLLSKNTSSSLPPTPQSQTNADNSINNSPSIQNVSSTNFFNTSINSNTNTNNNNNILIDLTCDDFDLNDLFMLHSNNEFSNLTSEQNQATNNNPNSINNNNYNNQIDSTQQQELATIKNEFDFKAFNFNIKDFTSCIEEILIDDEDDDEEMLNADKSNELMSSQQQQSNTTFTEFNSFKNYRTTNDSSSDTSCTTKNTSHRTNTVYKCDQCSKTFNKSFNYKRHMYVHSSKETSENSNSHFKRVPNECPNCKFQNFFKIKLRLYHYK